jgi:phage tail-like protein
MPQFSVNADPFETSRFRVIWDGKPVASVSKVSALRRTTEVVEYRDGGDPLAAHRGPGRTMWEPITLERGVTRDTTFEAWANQVFAYGAAGEAGDFRKNVTLELLDEAGQVALAYHIFRCWPSEYEALPDLDANANAVAFQRLVLQNEGWERDPAVTEPVET